MLDAFFMYAGIVFVGLIVLLLIGMATGHISFGTVEVKEDEHG